MPRVTGNVTDIAGRPASGRLQVRASAVRQNAAGSAVVDERTFEYLIVAGVITGTEVVDPGPATVSLSSGGRFKSWNVVVPEGATVDLWTLVEQYIDYEPPVVAAAQQAALDAQTAAANAAAAVQAEINNDVTAAEAAAVAAQQAAQDAADAASAVTITENPPGSGLYTVSTNVLTEDPAGSGLYTIGA